MAETEMSGDHATLLRHLRRTSFLAGIEEGRWRALSLSFPHLDVRVWGIGLIDRTHTMDFRLECRGFPAVGPFIERWDVEHGNRPPPPDARTAAPSVVDALKEWKDPHSYGGIYRPWQRGAAAHNNWANLRPDLAWHPKRDLTF